MPVKRSKRMIPTAGGDLWWRGAVKTVGRRDHSLSITSGALLAVSNEL